MHDWAEIRRLALVEKLSSRQIALRLGCNRRTVQRALAAAVPPQFRSPRRASVFDDFEPRVRELLAQYPRMPASVIAERVHWDGGESWFRERVAAIRPEYKPVDPVDRTSYAPGEIIQCDLWFPPKIIPVGPEVLSAPPVLTMVCGYSRWIMAMAIPTRTTEDLTAGMLRLLKGLGGAPKTLVWDNEAGIGRRNALTRPTQTLAGTLGTRIWQTEPYDPETKGMVERANRYLKESFLPGRAFSSGQDFNAQLAEWLPIANERKVRATGAGPCELLDKDLARMRPIPALHPHFGFQTRIRLGRDYYVRVLSNDYSVDPSAIGRLIDIRADLATVTAHLGPRLLASHERSWGQRGTITDPEHLHIAGTLRAQLGERPRSRNTASEVIVPMRNLADYDTLFNINLAQPTEQGHRY
ncbi:IS21 family transposase [Arthrobacter sp. YA7-1]|uniref:IS21 family transposase n=1 Tax=Arthrobacter sp. YA7-1 TaxID=2987701 RepID=UPI00222618DF|nr:IS21 family transposase [Arthrobacter sp. YA7-1]UYY83519.1 IS21 family transposase [Arthrobacter sp. YA7-1]